MDHLKYSLSLADGPADNGFRDLKFVHNCLPELSCRDITLMSSVAGISLKNPLLLNAVTGGAADVLAMNRQLAEFARQTESVMAVGSQYAALNNPEVINSYKVVRKVYPQGKLLANIGAYATVSQACDAVAMIDACGLQIHLNAAQEVIMTEGDRDFSGYLDNITKIVAAVKVPVIVKEVGCGIAKEQALLLLATGVKAIDVGGTGGTNFIAIEAARKQLNLAAEDLAWGIPTAVSALEVASVLLPQISLLVSGGIRTALDIVKSFALGASAVAMAKPVVKILQEEGLAGAQVWFENMMSEIRRYMLLLGAANISALQQVPVVISGESAHWLQCRGVDIECYARRQSAVK